MTETMKKTFPRFMFTLAACCIPIAGVAAEKEGLIATYRDDVREVSRVVRLPELGLAPDESPHPAIKPEFKAVYEGLLMVAQPGTYEFGWEGNLSLDGQIVAGAVKLAEGRHELKLEYERPQAEAARLGFSWKSEHFIKEPVPPSALRHEGKIMAEDVAGAYPSPPFRIAQAMAEMKCASCHEPDFLATMHHKFAPDALLAHMRHANPMKWYGAMTGPLFEENEMLTRLADDLKKLPGGDRKPGGARQDGAKAIAMVGTKSGLACIACHDIKHHRTAAESKGPNLAYVTQRVSYDWFVRWMTDPQRMKPGVPMPAFFSSQKPEERQGNIDMLWDYFSQGEEMPLPDELKADPKQFVLKPAATPLVNRAYIRLPDGQELLRAICVGLPNGISYCFDAETCRLAYVWSGGFLDMAPHWENQSGFPTPPVGETFYLPSKQEGLRIAELDPVFHGYEMVEGIPRFEFSIGETTFHLRIDSPSPEQLRQTYVIAKGDGPVEFIGPSEDAGVSVKASGGEWVGNRLTVPAEGKVELIMERKK
jgi:hypothetical protein